MKFAAVILLMSISAFTCRAQSSKQYRDCTEKAKAQGELTACASEELARVDAKRTDVYGKLLDETASQPEAAAKIKGEEAAWIAYRDAYVGAMYPSKNRLAEYGSVYPMNAALLRAKLTRTHTTDLRELLQHYGK